MSRFLTDDMSKMSGCQGPVGQPMVEICTWSHLKRDHAKRVGNSKSKRLWALTLGMEAEQGSGVASQRTETLSTSGKP